MVSQLPVLSGKRVGKRVPPDMVLPVFVLVVLFFALLIAYPWWVLTHRHGRAISPACRSAGCPTANTSARTPMPRRRPRRIGVDAPPLRHRRSAPTAAPDAMSRERPARLN